MAALARGVCRHHAEDRWFHETLAFAELSIDFSRRVRQATADAEDMRPSFLGHILVELLLDAELIEQDPSCVARYYAVLANVDATGVADAVSLMSGANAAPLADIIERFRLMRFLYDYVEDERLIFRLNQVMRRVGLAALPASFAVVLPAARRIVHRRADDLLSARPVVSPAMLAVASATL